VPQVPALLAVSVATAVGTLSIIQGAIYGGMIIHGTLQARKQRKAARSAFEASMKDRTVVIRSSDVPRTIVYGRARVSGPLVYAKSWGEFNEFLTLVIALGGHEFDAIEDIWFNDESIGPLDATGYVTQGRYFKTRTERATLRVEVPANGQIVLDRGPIVGVDTVAVGDDGDNGYSVAGFSVSGDTVSVGTFHAGKLATISYRYSIGTPLVRVDKYRGSPSGDGRLSYLEFASGGEWTAEHLGKGVPKIVVTLSYDQDIFPSGIPNISAIVRGKRVLDTRTGQVAWSNNPALCARDYLVSELGFGESPDAINVAKVNAAANVCDELVPGFDAQSPGSVRQSANIKRYTADGVLSTDEDRIENLGIILGSMIGLAAYSGGEWLIRAGAYVTPDATGLNANNLADGPIEVTSAVPRRELFNAVQGRFVDPGQYYQVVDFPRYASATYAEMDNGEELTRDIVLPMTANASRAQRIAKLILHRARQATTISATWKLAAYKYQPGDTLPLTIDYLGWNKKVFRVVDRRLRLPGHVHLVLQEEAAAVYEWDFDEDRTPDPAPNTELPNPAFVPAPVNMTVASGPDYTRLMRDGTRQAFLRVRWDPFTDAAVLYGGKIEIYIKRAIDVEYELFELPGSDTYFEYDVANNETYNIAVRARNGSQVRGEYRFATHTVAGAYVQPQGINFIGEFATHPPTAGLPEGTIYKNSVDKDTYILSGGVWSTFLESGEDGAAGTAKLLQLTSTSQVFKVSRTGVGSPSEIVLTAAGQNLAGSPTFAVTTGTATLTGTGNTRTLAFANMGSDLVRVQATQDGQTDTITVVKVYDGESGEDAVTSVLTNEAHSVAADLEGDVSSWAGVETWMRVFVGSSNDTAAWSFSRTNSTGVTSTIATTGTDRGKVSVTGMTVDTGWVDITATRTGYPTQTKRFTVSKSRQGPTGPAGESTKLLYVTASSQVVQIARTGTVNPTSILFTAAGQNLAGSPVFTVDAGTASLTGTGNTRTMAVSSMTTDLVRIKVAQDGQTDTITVVKVREGADGIPGDKGDPGDDSVVSLLTNEAHVISADSAGVVPAGLLPVTTDMDVFVGLVDDTINWSFTRVNGAGVTSSINNTAGSSTRGRLTVTALTVDTSYVDITATRAGYPTQVKRFTISKSKQGTGGSIGADGTRGSAHVYLSGQTAWNATTVNNHFTSTYGGKVKNDVATVYSMAAGFTQTRLWDGANWVVVEVAQDGRLILPGSAPGNIVTPGTLPGDALIGLPGHAMSITPDPGFEDLTMWSLTGSAQRVDAGTWGKFGRFAIAGLGTGSTDSAGVQSRRYVPITPGKRYRAIALMTAHSGNRTAYLYVSFVTSTGAPAYGFVAGWPQTYEDRKYFLVSQNPGGIEREFSIAFGPGTGIDIPADAAQMAIGCLIHDGNARTGRNSVSGLRIQQLQDTDLLAPNAATDLRTIRTSGYSIPEGMAGGYGGIRQSTTPGVPAPPDLTYTNTTDTAIQVVIRGSVTVGMAGIDGGGILGPPTGNVSIVRRFAGTSTAVLDRQVAVAPINSSWTSGTASPSAFVTLAPGETINADLVVERSGATVLTQVSSGTLSIELVKR
jgi:hypothetical protein